MIQTFLNTCINFLFPSFCFRCQKEGTSFCQNCLHLSKKSLAPTHSPILSVFDFQDPYIKKAIHAIKYFHKIDLLRPLTLPLCKIIEENISQHETWYITPIPMPKLRKLLRGYNQAEKIVDEIIKEIPSLVPLQPLTRCKSPHRQAMIKKRRERIDNQKSSFSLSLDVTNMNIILVDDVTTTGATLLEAKKVLKKGGARKVLCTTLAH